MIDAETILMSVEQKARHGKFRRWLDEDHARRKLYLEVMEKGYRVEGMPFRHVLRAFLAHHPEAPKVSAQTEKRLVDEHFDAIG